MKPVPILSTFALILFSFSAGAQQPAAPEPKVVTVGPTREIKLAENTWVRFGFQVQTWVRALQDGAKQPDGSEGGYAYDIYCRRCRIFATGSIVKDVTYNLLVEAGNFGRANPGTGDKGYGASGVQLLDGYGMVKFATEFQMMAGSMVVPLTRNGNQPTTTYVSIDVANTSATLLGQAGVLNVLRDLGIQFDGYLAENHFEYRVGVFQGLRAPGVNAPATPPSAGHNGPLLNVMLQYDFWDTEVGYVWGGHYYGTKKVLGLFGSFQYQQLRKADALPGPVTAAVGVDKNPFFGASGAAFINYPLSGKGNPQGGDEVVGLVQFNYYDGGTDPLAAPGSKFGSWPSILKQINLLAEAGYYNKDSKFSVFGRFEMRKINSDFSVAQKAAGNLMWVAGGLKYYVAPANLCNFGIQYERLVFNDALPNAQSGTNNITAQFQFLLY
jgi:hypothetical protein